LSYFARFKMISEEENRSPENPEAIDIEGILPPLRGKGGGGCPLFSTEIEMHEMGLRQR
jgi:hypothetical protein